MQEFNTDDIEVQNESAILNEDYKRLQGDAEYKRIPWQLVPGDTLYNENIQYVLGCMPKEKVTDVDTDVNTDTLKNIAKTFLQDVRGNACAINLHTVAKTDIVSVVEKYMSFATIEYILNFIKIEDHYQCLFTMIEQALLNYGNGDTCEDKLKYVINNAIVANVANVTKADDIKLIV